MELNGPGDKAFRLFDFKVLILFIRIFYVWQLMALLHMSIETLEMPTIGFFP